MKRFWLILATFLGLAATSVPAMADLQYTLNCRVDCTGSNGTGNYGTVTLKQLGTGTVPDPYHVQVTVKLAANEVFLTTGGHSGFTWNLLGAINPSSITVTSGNSALFAVQAFAAPGSYGNSPFGNFEYAIENVNTNGNGGILGPLVFDIKVTGGLILTNTLFSANSNGLFFAADIGRGCSLGGNGKWACGSRTGVVASNTTPVKVPEPGSMTLTIAGLAGMAGLMLLRRRKLAQAA
ncbi:MAG: PEP-CTERM sorting domain-containing protein [Rhizomicrobium sp.]